MTSGPTMSVTVAVTGTPDLQAAVQGAMQVVMDEMEGVLFEEGTEIINAAKIIVPFDQGILEASGGHYGTQRTPNKVSHQFGFGGAAAAYAVIQHETPPSVFSHLPGRQWKYLEQPLMEAVTTMPQRLSSRMAARLQSRFAGVDGGGGLQAGETFGGEVVE